MPQFVRIDGLVTTDYKEQVKKLLAKFFLLLLEIIENEGVRP